MGRAAVPFYDASTIRDALRPRAAVQALADALHHGLDPAAAAPRSIVPVEHGELLLMPGECAGAVGVKIATAAPGNAALGLPRIQGLYVLVDARTLTPRALLDGIELTLLRTPAVSLLAVRDRLTATAEPLHLVVVGTGPQAVRHVETTHDVLEAVRPIASVTYLSRHPECFVPPPARAAALVLPLGGAASDEAIARAGLVVCATSTRTPLFDGALVSDDAVLVAVGSHDPLARELDEQLMGRSHVVVEDVETALREAGDCVQAMAAGTLRRDSLIPLTAALADPEGLTRDRPLVFKSTGMGWQDAVVAAAVMAAIERVGE
ncbi:MAG: ornithine cyclodeaminase family protein [Nocardioides sp.]|nr:ornithine cyclodeaminase family protein [Nocardioides sp.]